MLSTITGHLPRPSHLEELFKQKHGSPSQAGWAPRRRLRFGYWSPSDIYEGTVDQLVSRGCRWLDVGGGRAIFPENSRLARALVERAGAVVAVDPSDNVRQNPFVHEARQCMLEDADFGPDEPFDLATARMVAEHVANPVAFTAALGRIIRPGGRVVVFTVNRRAPIAILTRLVPFRFHHAIKSVFWSGEAADTFPVSYLMNTRTDLRHCFEQSGFVEDGFAWLDDLSLFGAFRFLNYVELIAWWAIRHAGLRYPENCLLGVYRKR